VNERSILSLKRKALRRTKTLRRDPETQEVIPPSKLSLLITKLRKPFTRAFWEDAMESNDGETLVDGKLLSYAYLEAGIIEMVGA
jgi:sodium/potassium-transporting ATPase subunit alpha